MLVFITVYKGFINRCPHPFNITCDYHNLRLWWFSTELISEWNIMLLTINKVNLWQKHKQNICVLEICCKFNHNSIHTISNPGRMWSKPRKQQWIIAILDTLPYSTWLCSMIETHFVLVHVIIKVLLPNEMDGFPFNLVHHHLQRERCESWRVAPTCSTCRSSSYGVKYSNQLTIPSWLPMQVPAEMTSCVLEVRMISVYINIHFRFLTDWVTSLQPLIYQMNESEWKKKEARKEEEKE